MPTLTVDAVRSEAVTFVELLVEADRPHRVRIAFHHDGPTWPPRTDGRPAEGWDDGGVTTRVDAGVTPLGFATATPPAGVAVELVDAAPIDPDDAPEGVEAWLRRVERRVETAERLDAVEDVPDATRAVASVGGLSGLEALAADLARDRRLVSRLSVAPDGLQERLEDVDLSTEAFARLAGGPEA